VFGLGIGLGQGGISHFIPMFVCGHNRGWDGTQMRIYLKDAILPSRDENGTDIFRPYSIPNPFRGVLIRPYPSPDI
jgi:hypothetical protein